MNKRVFAGIAVCLFLVSLTQPAFYTDASPKDGWSSAVFLFLFGWLGLAMGSLAAVAWLANPLFITALVLFLKNRKMAMLIAIVATLLALSFLFMKTIVVSERPSYARITEYKAGYWLWLTSIAALAVFTIACRNVPVRQTPSAPQASSPDSL